MRWQRDHVLLGQVEFVASWHRRYVAMWLWLQRCDHVVDLLLRFHWILRRGYSLFVIRNGFFWSALVVQDVVMKNAEFSRR